MKFNYINNLLVLFCIFLSACNSFSECKKLNLSSTEKDWVTHFKKGEFSFYKNSKNQIDTLIVADTINYYTPCNKIELSKYQYEICLVSFRFKSKSKYNNKESNISVSTEEWKQRIPYIFFGNLGPHRNDLQNKLPIAIDTVLNGIKLSSVYYYASGLNTEQYGEAEYFKNFFWNKQTGLIAYTTMNNELFFRSN